MLNSSKIDPSSSSVNAFLSALYHCMFQPTSTSRQADLNSRHSSYFKNDTQGASQLLLIRYTNAKPPSSNKKNSAQHEEADALVPTHEQGFPLFLSLARLQM